MYTLDGEVAFFAASAACPRTNKLVLVAGSTGYFDP